MTEQKNNYPAPNDLKSLLTTPPEELTILFANFAARHSDSELGGTLRPNITTKLPRSKSVQMTFSTEQRPYAALSIDCLSSIADGRILGSDKLIPTLSERIIAEYNLSKYQGNLKFLHASQDAFLTQLTDFSIFHPNLIPALHRTLELAGAQGIETAMKLSMSFLKSAYDQNLTEENQKEYLNMLIPNRIFSGMHDSDTDDGIDPYEVRCTGKPLGKRIMNHSILAALKISSSSEPEKNDNDFTYAEGQIRNNILHHTSHI